VETAREAAGTSKAKAAVAVAAAATVETSVAAARAATPVGASLAFAAAFRDVYMVRTVVAQAPFLLIWGNWAAMVALIP